MKERPSCKMPSIRKAGKTESIDKIIVSILRNLNSEICSRLRIEDNKIEEILQNFTIKSELSGYNNQICLINFYGKEKNFLGDICLKYSIEQKGGGRLRVESNVLNILRANSILCPRVMAANFSDEHDPPYILMEVIKGRCINDHSLNMREAELILNIIQSHESILRDNLRSLQLPSITFDMCREINFENKLLNFLQNFAPDFIIKNSLNFLNHYLNDVEAINKRVIVTDRSVENIFRDQNNQIVMIDFSTIRIGTQFDNWIQFIDDPRIVFSCTKEKLIRLFFIKNNLSEKDLNYFYISSIYTNLLQGVFTYQKNSRLGIDYINNANNSFKKLTKKKGVLIDISQQHALK